MRSWFESLDHPPTDATYLIQLAAALALGAAGVNMGTAFMVVHEADIHPNIKKEIVKADERNTIHVRDRLSPNGSET